MAAPLKPTRAQSRYGVGFLRTLCAQAGYGLTETSPDEDVLAVDCTLDAPAAAIRVQVKCTTGNFTKKDRYMSFWVEDYWRAMWEQNINDAYFVVIRLGFKAQNRWVEHHPQHTQHNAAGYWARIDPQHIPTTIRVSESQRLTHSTFATWERHLVAKYGGGDVVNRQS